MCHPTILWYGCDHITFNQTKCPLDLLNIEHTHNDITLTCSADFCCLCTLPTSPKILELRNKWLSCATVARRFDVQADDKNMENLVTLFFEMGEHLQLKEYASLRLDGAASTRSPPVSGTNTPAPVEPKQIPSPSSQSGCSPFAKSKRGRPAPQTKQTPRTTQKNKPAAFNQSKPKAQTQAQAQIVQPPPSQTIPTPQSIPQSVPSPTPTSQFETEKDFLLAMSLLQYKHELNLSGGDFTDVDFEAIKAFIEMEEKALHGDGSQGQGQVLTGVGAAFDAQMQQASQAPVQTRTRVPVNANARSQQMSPIQRDAQDAQIRTGVDATAQRQRMNPARVQSQADPNVLSQRQQQSTTPQHTTPQHIQNPANVDVQPQQQTPIQHVPQSHDVSVQPEQSTPYDGTNWGEQGVYLPSDNVYFAGEKARVDDTHAQPSIPLPELNASLPANSSTNTLQDSFDEQASFSVFTNIDELCDESGDTSMTDVSSDLSSATAGSQGQNAHQSIDQYGSSHALYDPAHKYSHIQVDGYGRSTPHSNTQQPVPQQPLQSPHMNVFKQHHNPNAVTQLSPEEIHQIAAATKSKNKGRGKPRKATTASVTIIDNASESLNTDTPTNTTSTNTTNTTTTTKDPTCGISKTSASTSRVTKPSTTTSPSASTTRNPPRPRSRSNSNDTTTIKGKGGPRNPTKNKKEETNERKGTLVTIEQPPVETDTIPTEEYIQKYSNPVTMFNHS